MVMITGIVVIPMTAPVVQPVPIVPFEAASVLFVEGGIVVFTKGRFVAFRRTGVMVGIILDSWLIVSPTIAIGLHMDLLGLKGGLDLIRRSSMVLYVCVE